MACDALALAAFPEDRIQYAETLLGLSAIPETGGPALVLGVGADSTSSLERRLSMIVSARASGRVSRMGILFAGILALISVPGWTYGQSGNEDQKRAEKKKLLPGEETNKMAAAIQELAEAARQGDGEAAKKLATI
jgi:beta-lactamase regulating signal transducer with metallopeptidase domain